MLTQILGGVFLFGLCIFFHELGHFLIGKWCGIEAKVFSIGYGRGIWFKKVGRTIYQITAIPLGGYVQFYGDDPTQKHENLKKGDFFAANAWKRIALALGGPAFSLLLGFIVIFTLISLGWQPTSNKIRLVSSTQTPAAKADLKNGDQIIAVNGEETNSFEKVRFAIGLAPSASIKLKIKRGTQIIEKTVLAQKSSLDQYQIGIMAPGKDYIIITQDKELKKGALKKGDRILSVNNKPISKLKDLRAILNINQDKNVSIILARKQKSVITTGEDETISVSAPVSKKHYVTFNNVIDTQTLKSVSTIEIGSWQKKVFHKIFIDGQSFDDWSKFQKALEAKVPHSKRISFKIGSVSVSAQPIFASRGMLGIAIAEGVKPEKAKLSTSFGSMLYRTFDQTLFSTKSTLLGLMRIIQGKLSFEKSVSGPVKIFAIAYKTVEAGWEHFWFLLANITIILGIMNLLPIPVLDGGHIVFYLIEAVYKPVPIKAIAFSMRLGMMALLTLGIYVIGHDIWDIFFQGWL